MNARPRRNFAVTTSGIEDPDVFTPYIRSLGTDSIESATDISCKHSATETAFLRGTGIEDGS